MGQTSTLWKSNYMEKKKTRPSYKPKIRWELLGLPFPDSGTTTPIETIRKGVSVLASQGFQPGTSRTEHTTRGRGHSRMVGGNNARRRRPGK
ncbi:conserved protein of unknown function [Nitrospira japonica]|uniref:Uncharacterized protein n=1 Tax=Nitrospira japonica TaxID=1325564 RepID=A0A1W1I0B8_9BACT|nr:conserved protein of unknown function [Nitrospira japonica]